MTKLDEKIEVERMSDEALQLLRRRSTPPTEWQLQHFRFAIGAAAVGWYALARSELSNVFAANIADNSGPNPLTKLPGLATMTLDDLQVGLDTLKQLPLPHWLIALDAP